MWEEDDGIGGRRLKLSPPPPLGSTPLPESPPSLGQPKIGSAYAALRSASPLGSTRWSVEVIFSYASVLRVSHKT